MSKNTRRVGLKKKSSARELKVGDVVYFTGSPKMTVAAIDENDVATVMWFDESALCHERLPVAAIRRWR